MKKFVVSTTTPYDIIIGKDLIKDAGVYIHTCIPPCKVCVITDSTVNNIYAQVLLTSLMEHGYQTSKIVFPSGEHSKNLSTYSNILEALADEGLTRSDAIIALGGGVVGGGQGFGDHVDGVLRGGGHVDHFIIELLELGVKGLSHYLLLYDMGPGKSGHGSSF